MIKSKQIILQVFAIFTSDYRGLWSNSVEPDMWQHVTKRWQHALEKFNDETILCAANETFKFFGVSPPTLGQFYELCKKYRKDKEVKDMSLLENQPTKIKSLEDLTKIEPVSEIAKEELAKIKKILNEKGTFNRA